MARVPRSYTVKAGCSVHKVWRGHNREWTLETAEQKAQYLRFMNEDMEKYQAGCVVEALTLMSNHTHELPAITDPARYSSHMRRHHSRYGRYYNDEKKRCGKVAQDRAHTTLIGDEHHQMMATFYIHANPHRANIQDADRYEFSTHKLYAYGKRSPWMRNIKLPEWYKKLGRTAAERQKQYRKLFARYLDTYGRFKQKFLKSRFFGEILWVSENEKLVTAWQRTRIRGPS